MCVYDISEIEILEEDLVAYKVVKASHFEKDVHYSLYSTTGRLTQIRFEEDDTYYFYPIPRGETLVYKISEKTSSSFEDTPGLYCYVSKEALLLVPSFDRVVVLEILIPKGTKIKRAKSSKLANCEDIILTEELIPVKKVRGGF